MKSEALSHNAELRRQPFAELIRVLVADPDLSGWGGLPDALSVTAGFVVFRRDGTLSKVLTEGADMAPCVLLVGYDTVRHAAESDLRERLFKTPSVRLLVHSAPTGVPAERLLAQGVMGLLPESIDGPLLRKAVRAVDRGEIWAGRLLLSRLLRQLRGRLAVNGLSDREFEILELITQGLSNREIADQLSICRETVRWHIRSLYSKIGAKDRTNAVRYGRDLLLIESRSSKLASAGSSSAGKTRRREDRMAAD